MAQPAEMAKREMPLPVRAGREEVRGFAVIALPFQSGDVLGVRHWPASTFGPAYDSVWHRSPSGAWTIYSTVAPELSCARFWGAGIERAVATPIEIGWTGPRQLRVRVPAADLAWEMQLASTPTTRLMNLMMGLMPAALFRSNLVLSIMSLVSTALMAAGRFRLRGRASNKQWYQAGPRAVWMVPESRATIRGRDLGPLGPLPTQAALGDFTFPQRGVFMFGTVSFEAFSPERHLPAPKAQLAHA